ncbi:hypothetical protein NEF87_004770 [Candidatus Lokiarchaeum ossiferum]|uniref:Uncharacterized protein n=1 Tax=Candidatus Lokiarchaeum ossiferum TaxID=2951803 RepID=A0ABY6HYJ5_9ARCH|nr:hypothetical protein NEF87_004770 [Candidatus Lokiarchaeum sp. B-35]
MLNYIEDFEEHLKNRQNKAISEYKILFFIISIYDLLGVPPKTLNSRFIRKLSQSCKGTDQIYRLLCLQYIGNRDLINDVELFKLQKYQKPNGGFTIQNSAYADVNDTFWIGYTLESYKWLLPYRAGPLYSFIVAVFRHVNLSQKENFDQQIQYLAQMVVLQTNIFNSLMNEAEKLIFSNLSPNGLLDLKILSIQGGFSGSEQDIIRHINNKYQIQLDIMDNKILFRRFLNKINTFEEKIAIKLKDKIQTHSQLDITEFRKGFNRRMAKNLRIKDEELIKLLQSMMQEHFFTGKINKKSRFPFSHNFYFIRESYLEYLIVCNKPVSWENIRHEKRRLDEISKDIYSMTREMEISTSNIMNEIESLIIVGIDPEFIEERLTFNIKKTLMDASFFNKTIESFESEFELIKPQVALETLFKRWNFIYSSLQKNFQNVRRILTIKIGTLREEIDQHQLTVDLEKLISNKIGFLMEQFDGFDRTFRIKLESEYSRDNVNRLEIFLQEIETSTEDADHQVRALSLRISSKEKNIASFRKKVISRWISQLDEFKNVISYYNLGISLWNKKIGEIDINFNQFTSTIEKFKDQINQFIQDHDYSQALKNTETGFVEISKNIGKFSKNLKKDIGKYYKKNRKLAPLIRTIQNEWLEMQNILEEDIQTTRDQYSQSIQMDLKTHLRETLNLKVTKVITEMRQEIIKVEKQINSEILKEGDFPKSQYITKIQDLNEIVIDKSQDVSQAVKSAVSKYKKFDFSPIISNFEKFKIDFLEEIKNLERKFQGDELIYCILQHAKNQKLNFIPMSEISQLVKTDEKELLDQLSLLVTDGRLNARIFGDPITIEVHNESWRNYKRLRAHNLILLRELNSSTNKIEIFFEKSIQSNEFMSSIVQIRQLCLNFKQSIFQTLESYEIFIQKNNIDMKNTLLEKTYRDFYLQLEKLTQRVESFAKNCDLAEKYQDFLNQNTILLEENINSEIRRLHRYVDSRPKTSSSKQSIEWLNSQKNALNNGITLIDNKIEEFAQQNVMGDIHLVVRHLDNSYQQQKHNLLNEYQNALEDLLERIALQEINSMQKDMDKILLGLQNSLNDFIYNYDLEITNKIRSKEFLLASKKLKIRTQLIEERVKKIEKKMAISNKSLSNRSKIFSIKYSNYYKEQWEEFLSDFIKTQLQAKFIALQTEMILHFTFFSMKSLKGNYVPLRVFTEDLKIKHTVVKHALMTLISEDILPGKVDLSYDIYFEGSDELDAETIASLDIIKKTNVKFYMGISRVSNVMKLLYPFLASIPPIITIIYLIGDSTSRVLWVLAPMLILIFIISVVWIKKGKDKVKKDQLLRKSRQLN